jgi:hypothetical protein
VSHNEVGKDELCAGPDYAGMLLILNRVSLRR